MSRLQKYSATGAGSGFSTWKTPLSADLAALQERNPRRFPGAAVQKHCLEAIESENLAPLESPHIHDSPTAKASRLKFKADFEVLPKLEVRNYKGLEIEKTTVEVKEEEIEKRIKTDSRTVGPVHPVADRAVQSGDFAVISHIPGSFADANRAKFSGKGSLL